MRYSEEEKKCLPAEHLLDSDQNICNLPYSRIIYEDIEYTPISKNALLYMYPSPWSNDRKNIAYDLT
jgi:hypothetical protein